MSLPDESLIRSLLHDEQATYQTIQQLQEQIRQTEARIEPPILVLQIYSVSDAIEYLDPQVERLSKEYRSVDQEIRDYKGEIRVHNEIIQNKQLANDERKQIQDRIIKRLTETLSELTKRVKRYEDKYGPIWYEPPLFPWELSF